MSDLPNGFRALTDLDETGIREKLGLDADAQEFEYAPDRKMHLDLRKSPITEIYFGRPPSFSCGFEIQRRGWPPKPEEELIGEVSFVLDWLEDSKNCSAGLYHREGMPFAHWDTDGVVVNANSQLWETPESRTLRWTLFDRGIGYVVRKGEGPSYDSRGIVGPFEREGRPSKRCLWPELSPGSLELASSANALGFRFGRGSSFILPKYKGSAAEVDFAALESLLEEVATAVDENDERIADLDRWQPTIIDMIALVLLNDQRTPEQIHPTLQAQWGDLAAQRAAELSAHSSLE